MWSLSKVWNNKRKLKNNNNLIFVEISIIVVEFILLAWLLITRSIHNYMTTIENSGLVGDSFGAVNALFSGFAFAAVVVTLISQIQSQSKNSEIDRYFKMIDFYQIGISNITTIALEVDKDSTLPPEKIQGRKAFAEMKLQLKKLLDLINRINTKEQFGYTKDQVASIAYLVFYYGANAAWKDLLNEVMRDVPRHDELVVKILDYIKAPAYNRYALGRTNQTDLSTYFRNMYNSIKMIDDSKRLSEQEKYDYVKVLRAQLSNPELYILFFNVISPFGENWKNSGYIKKYNLLDNIPSYYCDGYNPRGYSWVV